MFLKFLISSTPVDYQFIQLHGIFEVYCLVLTMLLKFCLFWLTKVSLEAVLFKFGPYIYLPFLLQSFISFPDRHQGLFQDSTTKKTDEQKHHGIDLNSILCSSHLVDSIEFTNGTLVSNIIQLQSKRTVLVCILQGIGVDICCIQKIHLISSRCSFMKVSLLSILSWCLLARKQHFDDDMHTGCILKKKHFVLFFFGMYVPREQYAIFFFIESTKLFYRQHRQIQRVVGFQSLKKKKKIMNISPVVMSINFEVKLCYSPLFWISLC